jgi:hypothetical protein
LEGLNKGIINTAKGSTSFELAPRETLKTLGGAKSFQGKPSAMSASSATLIHVSTEDQILSSELHGEALLTARRPELQPLIDHLREVAQGRDDIRTECAGIIAGSWFASPARRGEDLIAAGLLMLPGHVDLDELDHWIQVGWEPQRGATDLYPESEY